MSAHTPGPWRFAAVSIEISSLPAFVVQGPNSYDVCEIHGDLGVEEGDARLIAAAPDLLAALIAVELDNGTAATIETLTLVRAAIAKAKGAP